MKRHAWMALVVLVAWCGWPLLATASTMSCTVPEHVPPARLSGEWRVTLWPEGGADSQPRDVGTLWLERHVEFEASVHGNLLLGGTGPARRSLVSGDVTEGVFHLEESDDGQRMSAVWAGVAEDCAGRLTITGTRRTAEGVEPADPVLAFRIEKAPGWR